MPKNLSVIDTKPRNLSIVDTKPKNFQVLDTKPKNFKINDVDDVVVYLYSGASIGPGWFMYVTYPNTILIYP